MPKIFVRSCAAALLLCLVSAVAFAAIPEGSRSKSASTPAPVANFDARVNGGAALSAAAAARPAASATLQARPPADLAAEVTARGKAAIDFKARIPSATVEFSPGTLAPENVYSNAGPLTAPSSAPSFDIAKAFLRSESSLYGLSDADIDALDLIGESLSPSGLRMLRVRQVVNGRPVFLSETRILLDAQGSILRTLGALVPGATAIAEPDSHLISASTALVNAMSSVGITLQSSQVHEPAALGSPPGVGSIVVDNAEISGQVNSALVYFPLMPGTLIPAWQQVTFTHGSGDYTTVVDAVSGAVLWRKNIRSHASTQDARFSVYVQGDDVTPTSPAPHAPTTQAPGAGTQYPAISRTIVSMFTAQNLTASPNGWITDGGSTTTGNNVDAYLDLNGSDTPNPVLDTNPGRPTGNPDTSSNNRDFLGATPRDYGYTPAPLGSNPDAGDPPSNTPYQRGAVTNLFYLTNWYHDKLYALGFNEAAGNFQSINFGPGGVAGDPVLAEAQDGGGFNGANFSTPPDGISGIMRIYIFNGPTPNRDGSIDPDVVLHELTHGTSNRLIGNGNGLLWDIGGGMGEGWSDFYALSLQHNTAADDPNGEYGASAWTVYKLVVNGSLPLLDNYLYGIRAFPYSTNNTINPQTWADVDDVTQSTAGGIAPSPLDWASNGAGEVHNVGEIWANTLWEVRSRVIAANGGSIPTGNGKMLQLVTDALKMTPANPSYLQGRDAIIAADCAHNACADEDSIWGGFADRGLGYGAIAPLAQSGAVGFAAYTGINESFLVPHLDVQSVAIDDTQGGNGNGKIDPGEQIKLTPTMFNPWRATSKNITSAVAVLSTSTPGVTITQNTSMIGAVAAQATLAGTPFQISVAVAALCGESLDFTVAITSQPGGVVSSATFKLRVGAASGTDTPITYTSTIAGGLSIPDNNLRGVTNVLSISDDKEINHIQFRVDNLTHTFVGDLGLGLKGPSGYGATMIFHTGADVPSDGNPGPNFINTVIDDASANDLSTAPNSPGFTGTWKTAFNAPLLFPPGLPTDPVGQLSRFNGGTTEGNWTVFVADWAQFDTGTLNSWSVIVTPTHFVCAAVAPSPVLQSVVSRKVHGSAGTFDLPLSLVLTNPTTEPRTGPAQQLVFTYDKPLSAATATVTEGTATASSSIVGSTVVVNLTGVTNKQYVTVTLSSVSSTDGGTGGTGVARVGFLLADVNQNRVVSLADLVLINAQLAKLVGPTNFLKDVNANGTLTFGDILITNNNLAKALPAP